MTADQGELQEERPATAGEGVPGARDDAAAGRDAASGRPDSGVWDDGLIARRSAEAYGRRPRSGAPERSGGDPWADAHAWRDAPIDAAPGGEEAAHGQDDRPVAEEPGAPAAYGTSLRTAEGPLRTRLEALRELVGLSRTRLDGRTLAEAGRVLDEAAARQRLSLDHSVVAIAGATGSGKSSLFNALTGVPLSEVGSRRPTTCEPSACAWRGPGDEAPLALLERLGMPPRAARPAEDDAALRGLVLVDLPDHDSAVAEHRALVERVLGLADAVIWVVDPEKYADAVLHERYLRPLAGYAEVTFVVLNQVDRLPDGAAEQVLDDLRRLLDEDGLALGEHGEPGSCVLGVSALSGDGVGELRGELASILAGDGALPGEDVVLPEEGTLLPEQACVRRAGMGVAERRLSADVDGAVRRLREVYVAEQGATGLGDQARDDFEDRLAEAVGANAAGRAAERAWLGEAERACASCWTQLWRWYRARWSGAGADGTGGGLAGVAQGVLETVAGGRFGTADEASERPADEARAPYGGTTASRPVVEQAVRALAAEAGAGLPAPWAQAVREAAVRGADGLAEGLDMAVEASDGAGTGSGGASVGSGAASEGDEQDGAASGGRKASRERRREGRRHARGGVPRPRWWSVVGAVQNALFMLQMLCVLWLLGAAAGAAHLTWQMLLGFALVCAGSGPMLSMICRLAARGPARRFGQEVERGLRVAAAGCGRARVLEPVAAELLRYREVREQYVVAAGGAAHV